MRKDFCKAGQILAGISVKEKWQIIHMIETSALILVWYLLLFATCGMVIFCVETQDGNSVGHISNVLLNLGHCRSTNFLLNLFFRTLYTLNSRIISGMNFSLQTLPVRKVGSQWSKLRPTLEKKIFQN